MLGRDVLDRDQERCGEVRRQVRLTSVGGRKAQALAAASPAPLSEPDLAGDSVAAARYEWCGVSRHPQERNRQPSTWVDGRLSQVRDARSLGRGMTSSR
jgi:hypothetical protein